VRFVRCGYQATLERSVRKLDADHDSPLGTFECETLVMALGLLGALVADTEQVFHQTIDVTQCWSMFLYVHTCRGDGCIELAL